MQLIFEHTKGSAMVQLNVLKAICGNTEGKSMIDLGAGLAPITRMLNFTDRVFVDVVKRDLKEENENFVQQDIFDLIKTNYPSKCDVSISLDNIEHFWEWDGRRVIKWMETNSTMQIIFTPLGYYMNIDDRSNKDPDTHKSGWVPAMLPDWAHIVFRKFHPTLGAGGLGAFFSFKCPGLPEEFARVSKILRKKYR